MARDGKGYCDVALFKTTRETGAANQWMEDLGLGLPFVSPQIGAFYVEGRSWGGAYQKYGSAAYGGPFETAGGGIGWLTGSVFAGFDAGAGAPSTDVVGYTIGASVRSFPAMSVDIMATNSEQQSILGINHISLPGVLGYPFCGPLSGVRQ